jgi:hypothetical protein
MNTNEIETNPPAAARFNILADGKPEILADGYSVSRYALACGAVQATERLGSGGWKVELYQEHGAYHVRSFDYAKRDVGAALKDWTTWATFERGRLTQARAEVFRLLRSFGWHDIRNR